ncbi:O-antigen polymerase [Polynucleobacter sp. Tro8-14-1]|uniref:O-antigen polymerase n=1 Tax=Polynucleobacter sp. Tro8-14-1 TaxID=1758383 RepID=UPI001C0AE3E1|nr:oligosaccharide repeat unit polymerase [Polynucleobacter sp. Tro8-14-1]
MKNIKLNILIDPMAIYIIIWSITALLISLGLTVNLENFSGEGALLVYITIFTATGFLFYEKHFLKKYPKEDRIDLFKLQRLANNLFSIWIALIIIYSYLAGGFGLLWLIKGIQVDYADVQIPSLWGLNITLCYILGCIYLFLIINSKIKYNIKLYVRMILILIFPILIFSRNVMLQLFLQLICVAVLNSNVKLFKSLTKILLAILILIYIFGLVGDNRTVDGVPNPFSSYVIEDYKYMMSSLPSGFTWIYMYITANYNNVLYSISSNVPTYEFYPILMNLVPGALKEIVFGEAINTNSVVSSIVKDPNLTVASFYAGPIIAFGLAGGIVGGLFIQIFSLFWYRLALTKNFGYELCYSAIFACMFFSIFYDAFFTMGTLTQIIVGIFIAKKCRNKPVFLNQIDKVEAC